MFSLDSASSHNSLWSSNLGRLFLPLTPTVLTNSKSIRFNHIKGFNVLSLKKHLFKINKIQSGYGFDLFVLCSRGGNFIFFIPCLINHRIISSKLETEFEQASPSICGFPLVSFQSGL